MPDIEQIKSEMDAKQETSPSCGLCERSFSHKYYLNNHIRIKHVENPEDGKCDQCGEGFKNQHQLKRHRYQRHDLKKNIKCEHCEKMFSNTFSKEKHNKRIHLKEKNFSCPKCYYRGFDFHDLKYHTMNKHSDKRPHRCVICTNGVHLSRPVFISTILFVSVYIYIIGRWKLIM